MDLRALPLTPMEGFVVSRIDAAATVQDLADLTNLDPAEVDRTITKLIDLGAVEWADGAISLPRASHRPSVPDSTPRFPPPYVTNSATLRGHVTESEPPRAMREQTRGGSVPPPPRRPSSPYLERVSTSETAGPGHRSDDATSASGTRSASRGATSEAGTRSTPGTSDAPRSSPAASNVEEQATRHDPRAPAPETTTPSMDDGIELPLERRKRIDDIFPKLDVLDHYTVLGVDRGADTKAVRAAYFDLSKVFHPDTAFRKSIGPYRSRMESIFKRLTEAYEVLGKKKARAEYDAYLGLQYATREVEEAMATPSAQRGRAASTPALADAAASSGSASASGSPSGSGSAPASASPSASAPGSVPAAASASSGSVSASGSPSAAGTSDAPSSSGAAAAPPEVRATLSEEGKRRARELLQLRLGGVRHGEPARTPEPRPAASSPVPSEPRARQEVLRDLTSSLKGAAAQTGGVDPVMRNVMEARRHDHDGDLASAARAMRTALTLAPDREDIKSEHRELARRLAVKLADQYRMQAQYEERHRKWAAAAVSWAKVVDGRPDDLEAVKHAAAALLEAKGDLHNAQKFAMRGCELAPNDPAARTILARVYIAAGLNLNARRELERAATLDPTDQIVKNLLREL